LPLVIEDSHIYADVLIVHAGVGAEAYGGSEKNQLHRGTWMPEGGPAFIPVSDVDSLHLVGQPTQRIGHQSNEEQRCVKKLLCCFELIDSMQQL